jgi:hypothetical protein
VCTRRDAVIAQLVLTLALAAEPSRILGRAETLGAVEGVAVVVEDLDRRAVRLGLDPRQLQAQVEDRVLTGGVRLLDEDTLTHDAAAPLLYVRVQMLPVTRHRCAVSVEVQLMQLVELSSGERAWGVTWSQATLLKSDPRKIVQSVKIAMARQLQGFTRTWHAAHGLGRSDVMLAGRR